MSFLTAIISIYIYIFDGGMVSLIFQYVSYKKTVGLPLKKV